MSKHTPGPWHWLHNTFGSGGHVYSANHRRLADVMERYAGIEEEEMVANARVMALAPEMLNALEHIAATCPGRAAEIANVIIAKLGGQS